MMRRCLLVSVVLVGVLLLVSAAADQDDTTQVLSRGESITKALATVTSTAISPLLGVSVMGAWQYFRTPKAQRGQLPFFDRPYFWIPTVALLVLIFIKDTFGGFAPLIKKPLDAIEVLFVNHAALILIVFPVVMHQVARMMGYTSLRGLFAELLRGPVVYAATIDAAGVHHAFNVATALLYTAAGFVLAGVVWLLGH